MHNIEISKQLVAFPAKLHPRGVDAYELMLASMEDNTTAFLNDSLGRLMN